MLLDMLNIPHFQWGKPQANRLLRSSAKHILFTSHCTQDDGLSKNDIVHNKFKDNVSIKEPNRFMLAGSLN